MVENAEYDHYEAADERHPNSGGQDVYHSALSMGGKLYTVKIKLDVTPETTKKRMLTKRVGFTLLEDANGNLFYNLTADIDAKKAPEGLKPAAQKRGPQELYQDAVASRENTIVTKADGVNTGLDNNEKAPEPIPAQSTAGAQELYQDAAASLEKTIVTNADGVNMTLLHHANPTPRSPLHRFANSEAWLLTGRKDSPADETGAVNAPSPTQTRPSGIRSELGATELSLTDIPPLGVDGKPLFQEWAARNGHEVGRIHPEIAQTLRLGKPGSIWLDDIGTEHIEERHGAEIRGLGFNSVRDFVDFVLGSVNAVYAVDGSGRKYDLVS